MLKLSRKTLLALEAVIDIAFNARPEPVQAKEITARQGVPQRYLEQVMQQLVRAGILKGVRGPRGGYELARERRRITVAEVVRVVESEADDALENFPSIVRDIVQPAVSDAERAFEAALDAVTVEDLCRAAAQDSTRRGMPEGIDFTI